MVPLIGISVVFTLCFLLGVTSRRDAARGRRRRRKHPRRDDPSASS
jgi:hypothetical protein